MSEGGRGGLWSIGGGARPLGGRRRGHGGRHRPAEQRSGVPIRRGLPASSGDLAVGRHRAAAPQPGAVHDLRRGRVERGRIPDRPPPARRLVLPGRPRRAGGPLPGAAPACVDRTARPGRAGAAIRPARLPDGVPLVRPGDVPACRGGPLGRVRGLHRDVLLDRVELLQSLHRRRPPRPCGRRRGRPAAAGKAGRGAARPSPGDCMARVDGCAGLPGPGGLRHGSAVQPGPPGALVAGGGRGRDDHRRRSAVGPHSGRPRPHDCGRHPLPELVSHGVPGALAARSVRTGLRRKRSVTAGRWPGRGRRAVARQRVAGGQRAHARRGCGRADRGCRPRRGARPPCRGTAARRGVRRRPRRGRHVPRHRPARPAQPTVSSLAGVVSLHPTSTSRSVPTAARFPCGARRGRRPRRGVPRPGSAWPR